MSGWIALLLQAGSAVPVPRAPFPTTLPRAACGGDDAESIIVCGRRADRNRLPLPLDRAETADRRVPGEAPRATAALTPGGACGLFARQRSCSKAEAARYGYGAGRDPVTVLGKLGRKLLDPDAELAEPATAP